MPTHSGVLMKGNDMTSIFDVSASEGDVSGRDLGQAVESLLAGWAERVAVPVEVWALPTKEVPDELARLAYRVLVDALARVEGAREVSVAMTTGKTLRLTVSCEGRTDPHGKGTADRNASGDDAGMSVLHTQVKARRGVYSTGLAGTGSMTITLELPLP